MGLGQVPLDNNGRSASAGYDPSGHQIATLQVVSVQTDSATGVLYGVLASSVLPQLVCVASKITGKVWQSGTAEPSGWNMSVTDTAVASGGFAILGQTNGGSTGIQFDNFSAVPFASIVRAPSRIQRRFA